MADPFVLQVVLPWPSNKLSQNFRGHWSQRSKAVKAARSLAGWQTIAQNTPIAICMLRDMAKVSIHYVFNPPDRRKRDDDGMVGQMKAFRDGIADALDMDDSCFRSSHEIGEPVKGGSVTVTIKGAV